jgi:large subunit ribosomal protein L24
MYIKTNDTVQVTAGKERGKTGKVLRVDLQRGRVVVEGLNVVKRHRRPTALDPQGGITEKEAAIDASNVLLYSEKLQRGVRVAYRFEGRGGEYHSTREAALASFGSEPPQRVKKVRFCAKTGEVFE